MNEILVKKSLMQLKEALAELTGENNSRSVSVAKTKIQEAIFWLQDALDIEDVALVAMADEVKNEPERDFEGAL